MNFTKCKIVDVCDIYQPHTISTKEMVCDGKYNVYGANGIIGKYDKYNHEESEVVMACRGATCGALNITEPFSWINGNAMVIKPNGSIPVLQKYLYYFLLFSNKDGIITGTAQPQITRSNMSDFSIYLCDTDTQQRIVSKIEELFSKLDKGVEELNKIKEQLKIYRQTIFSNIINSYEGTNAKLCDVSDTIDGDRGKNYPKQGEFSCEGYCLFLTAKNVRPFGWKFDDKTFITKEKDNILRNGKMQLNDVVITTRGTLGNVAVYDETVPYENVRINSCMLIIRPQTESITPNFLAYYLMSPMFQLQIEKLKSGTAQPQIPANVLKEIELSLPSINNQKIIVGKLQEHLSVCDKIEQTVNESLQKAESLRQSILKQAFEGKLIY